MDSEGFMDGDESVEFADSETASIARFVFANDLHIPRRPITGDDRKCSNCIAYSRCYRYSILTPRTDDSIEGMPYGFRLKELWNSDRFKTHMERILGQICLNFHSSDPEIERHFHKPEPGWNYEENV